MVWLEKGGPAGFGWLKGAWSVWSGWLKGARAGMVWLVERSLHVPDTSAVSEKKNLLISLCGLHFKLYLLVYI